ncbi:MAG: hypothetical protein ACK4OM_05230 [Alphaproteobacteria bacterium]
MKTKEDLILEEIRALTRKVDNLDRSLKSSYSSNKLHNDTVKYYNDVIKLMIQWSVMDKTLFEAVQLYFSGGDWKAGLTSAYLKGFAFKLGLAWMVKGIIAPGLAEYIATPIHEYIYDPIKEEANSVAKELYISAHEIKDEISLKINDYYKPLEYMGENYSDLLLHNPNIKIY